MLLTLLVAVIAFTGCAGAIAASRVLSSKAPSEQSVDEVVRLIALRLGRSALTCALALATALATRLLPIHLALMTPHPIGALVARGLVLIATRAGWISA